MFPERWGARYWSISEFRKVGLEAVVGDFSSLFQTWHALSNFDVDVAVFGDKREEIVLVDDFLWNELDRELHVLIAFHGCAIVKILDIQDHEFGIWSRDGAVEETFGGGETGALCRGHAGEIEFVAADSDSDSMGFVFGGSNGGNEASIGDFPAFRHSGAGDEINCVGTGGHTGTYALCEASEIIGQCFDPDLFVWAAAEGIVLEGLSGDFVDDGMSLRLVDLVDARA